MLDGSPFLEGGDRYDVAIIKEIPKEKLVKSSRKPLIGGDDISVDVRDKVMSIMQKNRIKSLT